MRIVFTCLDSISTRNDEEIVVTVSDFPCIPKRGDIIWIEEFISEDIIKNYNEKQKELLWLCYAVEEISWKRDEKGVYAESIMEGE